MFSFSYGNVLHFFLSSVSSSVTSTTVMSSSTLSINLLLTKTQHPIYQDSISLLWTCPNYLSLVSLFLSDVHISDHIHPYHLPKRTSVSSSLLPPGLPPVVSLMAAVCRPKSVSTPFLSFWLKIFYHALHLKLSSTGSSLPIHSSSPLFHAPVKSMCCDTWTWPQHFRCYNVCIDCVF